MKKLISLALATVMTIGMSTMAFAADIKVTVNGKNVAWTDAKPYIDSNNRTLVPLRPIAEAMGLNVDWDEIINMAMFSSTEGFAEFTIGSRTMECGNMSGAKTVSMDTAATIVNGRTYAPARYLAEAFGYNVGWDGNTSTVTISRGKVETVVPAPAGTDKMDPLPPDNITAQPDWYITLTPAHKMTNARLVAEVDAMEAYLENHTKTDPTQIRLYDLWAELSKRTGALDRYAEYATHFGEADAASIKDNEDYKRAVASDITPLKDELYWGHYYGLE